MAELLKSIDGPIVLVGHSYGGMVATNAAAGNDSVKALVYVAALAPDKGENVPDLTTKFPGATLGDAVVGVPLPDGTTDFYVEQSKYHEYFGADLSPNRPLSTRPPSARSTAPPSRRPRASRPG